LRNQLRNPFFFIDPRGSHTGVCIEYRRGMLLLPCSPIPNFKLKAQAISADIFSSPKLCAPVVTVILRCGQSYWGIDKQARPMILRLESDTAERNELLLVVA
jgi:hypothetical protein